MRTFSILAAGALPLISLVAAQQTVLPPCRQNFTTNVWTSCANVVSQFQLSLAEFLYANPQLGAGCDGFKPGETYCISHREYDRTKKLMRDAEFAAASNQRLVSTDGNCGIQNRTSPTCVGSSFGNCCNASGRYEHCAHMRNIF